MEKRKLDLLMLSSDSDLWNLSQTPLSSSSSLCFLFFRLLRRSLALFELSLDVPEDDSEVGPPLPLYSPLSVAAAAATCWPIRAQTQLSWRPGACLKGSRRLEQRREAGSWEQPQQRAEPNKPQTPSKNWRLNVFMQTKTCLNSCIYKPTRVRDKLAAFFVLYKKWNISTLACWVTSIESLCGKDNIRGSGSLTSSLKEAKMNYYHVCKQTHCYILQMCCVFSS